MTTNEELQAKYDAMHSKGSVSWFSNGENEREAILVFGHPWGGRHVLEIGCGEGDLACMMCDEGANVTAVDYSAEAIAKAEAKYAGWPNLRFSTMNYKLLAEHESQSYDRVVMQGVLEHFNKPWVELDWIIRNLVKSGGDLITSSPCFTNPRGIVWMTLILLFDAPMSLTDLHSLHPWDFRKFAAECDAVKSLKMTFTDNSWGAGEEMVKDFAQRLPKVFPNLYERRTRRLVEWLDKAKDYMDPVEVTGATAVYRFQREE